MITANFRVRANEDFSWSQKFGADFSGSTFKMQIKNTAGTVLATLTSPSTGITSDNAAHSTLTFFLARADLPVVGEYSYDLLRVTGSNLENLIGGKFIVLPGITTP